MIGLFVIGVVLFLPDGLVGPLKSGRYRLPLFRQRPKKTPQESVGDA